MQLTFYKTVLRTLQPALARQITGLILLLGLFLAGNTAKAQPYNYLANPGAETGDTTDWTIFGGGDPNVNNWYSHSGTYAFSIYANNQNNLGSFGMFQLFPIVANQKFTADGWYGYVQLRDTNASSLQVSFLDGSGNTLALYSSILVTNGSPSTGLTQNGGGYDLFVTNQLDLNTGAIINTVTNLVAPAGATQVKFAVVIIQGVDPDWYYDSVYWDDFSLLSATLQTIAPSITNLVPANIAFATNKNFSCDAIAQSGAIVTNVQLIVTSGQGLSTNISTYSLSSADFTVTGLNTDTVHMSYSLSNNIVYSVTIMATDNRHLTSSSIITFNTLSYFTWEAEDYDFNGGQFIDNPVPTADSTYSSNADPQPLAQGTFDLKSYYAFPATAANNTDQNTWTNIGLAEIDYHAWNNGQQHQYRAGNAATNAAGVNDVNAPGVETCGDVLRQRFLDARIDFNDSQISDFDAGGWQVGMWLNYTRNYPAGRFYVYGRLAGSGAFSGTTLSIVTNGVGSTNQSATLVGSFADANPAGWQVYHWVPMLDTNNQAAILTLTGKATLRLTGGNSMNANFYMLVPAPSSPNAFNVTVSMNGQQPGISFPTQAGFTYKLVYKVNLQDLNWTVIGSVTGDGSTKSLTDTGASRVGNRFYAVQAQ